MKGKGMARGGSSCPRALQSHAQLRPRPPPPLPPPPWGRGGEGVRGWRMWEAGGDLQYHPPPPPPFSSISLLRVQQLGGGYGGGRCGTRRVHARRASCCRPSGSCTTPPCPPFLLHPPAAGAAVGLLFPPRTPPPRPRRARCRPARCPYLGCTRCGRWGLVAESESVCPPSVGGECALGTDVLEDRQEEFQCLAAASPHLVSVLLTPEGDPDALDIPTPRSYAEAIEGPYSSQWQAAMDAEMASWKSTGTYVDEVPPPGANIVSGMWIFRVKRPPSSPPVVKARYVARGFSQR
ncbi:unnamed protein product [Closterium sp. NIES-54]